MTLAGLTTPLLTLGVITVLATAGVYQAKRAGEWKQSADHLATLVAEQARENQRQQQLLGNHLREKRRLQKSYEEKNASLEKLLRDSSLADCIVPLPIRVQLDPDYSAGGSTAAPDRAN